MTSPTSLLRRKSYLTPGISLSQNDSQSRRRAAALVAQKEARQHAFEGARASASIDFMEDLSQSGDEGDSDSDTAPHENGSGDPLPVVLSTSPSSLSTSPRPVVSKRRRSSYKPKHKAWAKNLLMHAETMDLREGLPHGLESDWYAVAVPRGKRCLCATGSGSGEGGVNTVLISRVAGRTLAKRRTALPPDCLCDCVWDEALGVLWVLDLIKWRGTWYNDSPFELRSFFLTSKLSELPTQPFTPPPPTPANPSPSPLPPLLLLPCPLLPPPLTPPLLLPFFASLLTPHSTPSLIPVTISPPLSPLTRTVIQVPFHPTGMLLYLKEALYISGTTTLAGWVPRDVEDIGRRAEGVGRMVELVQEWAGRGGNAGEEVVMMEGEGGM